MNVKFIRNQSFDKMTREELLGISSKVNSKYKEKVLSYLKSFAPYAFTSQPIIDKINGQTIDKADNGYSDGVYIWYESEIYYYEKYNLKLKDDFINYVLSK